MDNKIHIRPQHEITHQLFRLLNPNDIVIPIERSIIHKMVEGSHNIIIITGQATGKMRLQDALRNTLSEADRVAPDYNLSTGTMMILHINYSKSHDLIMDELKYLVDIFEDKKLINMQKYWGVSVNNDWEDDRLEVRMVVRNLGRK